MERELAEHKEDDLGMGKGRFLAHSVCHYLRLCEYSGDYKELLYLRARFYAANTGRFLTRDTWSGNTLHPKSLNRWSYVEENPVNYTDPSGFIPCAENQNIDVNRLCILERGGYLDVEHFVLKKRAVQGLIDIGLPSKAGQHFGQILIDGWPMKYHIPFTYESITYLTAIPSTGLPRVDY